eukprot:9468059-Pyramimonas_sp.AAC.1
MASKLGEILTEVRDFEASQKRLAEEAKLKKAQETQSEQAQQNGVKAEAGPDFPNVDEADVDEMR